jgi:hypothetical protein
MPKGLRVGSPADIYPAVGVRIFFLRRAYFLCAATDLLPKKHLIYLNLIANRRFWRFPQISAFERRCNQTLQFADAVQATLNIAIAY